MLEISSIDIFPNFSSNNDAILPKIKSTTFICLLALFICISAKLD